MVLRITVTSDVGKMSPCSGLCSFVLRTVDPDCVSFPVLITRS